MFDKVIKKIQQVYGITQVADWQDLRPVDVLKIDKVGPVTLDHIRLYLAGHNVTLKNDATPAYWKKYLSKARIVQQLSGTDQYDVCPFTVLVDSMEQQPFSFEGFRGDATQEKRPMFVPTKYQALGVREGRYYIPRGDYSIDGHEGNVHVERKSMRDAHGTFLGYKSKRKERFERELEVLASIPTGAVVIECSFGRLLRELPDVGEKPLEEKRKSLYRQILAWQMDYRVPWYFCDDRRLAEVTTFQILNRYFKHYVKDAKNDNNADHARVA